LRNGLERPAGKPHGDWIPPVGPSNRLSDRPKCLRKRLKIVTNSSQSRIGAAWRVEYPLKAAWFRGLQIASPVECRTGVMLAPRGDIAVTDDKTQRPSLDEHLGQASESPILRLCKGSLASALEFDTDRKIVAALSPLKTGLPGMPGAVVS
jgi:hypothetical protein